MKQKILDLIQQEITEDNKNNDFYPLTTQKAEWLNDFKKKVEAINYTRCCETSIADLQISDKITFKQHRSGIITDVYINELQVKDVNGNYKTIGKNDVIEKH